MRLEAQRKVYELPGPEGIRFSTGLGDGDIAFGEPREFVPSERPVEFARLTFPEALVKFAVLRLKQDRAAGPRIAGGDPLGIDRHVRQYSRRCRGSFYSS